MVPQTDANVNRLLHSTSFDAEIILSVISRSSDLTKRGVRGIIAEAIFERKVVGTLKGWEVVSFPDDRPYDFLIRSKDPKPREVRIQVKLQRMRKQQPMMASEANRHYPNDMYVVELQKTRGGIDPRTNENPSHRFPFDKLRVIALGYVVSWLRDCRAAHRHVTMYQWTGK